MRDGDGLRDQHPSQHFEDRRSLDSHQPHAIQPRKALRYPGLRLDLEQMRQQQQQSGGGVVPEGDDTCAGGNDSQRAPSVGGRSARAERGKESAGESARAGGGGGGGGAGSARASTSNAEVCSVVTEPGPMDLEARTVSSDSIGPFRTVLVWYLVGLLQRTCTE